MIKINLLPTEGPGPTKVYFELFLGLILIAVGVGAIGVYWNYLNTIIDKRNEEIRVKEDQIKKLQDIIDNVKKYETEKDVLQKKIDLIKKLRDAQKAPVLLLDQLSKNVPDNVWYHELKSKGNTLELKGASLSMMSIGDLINGLKQDNGLFENVRLKKSSMKDIKGREIYSFEMELKLFQDKEQEKAKGKDKGKKPTPPKGKANK